MLFNRAYYLFKPLIPWRVRLAVRRRVADSRRAANANVWPIDEAAGMVPPGWPGWPDGHRFAFVLTHDVEGVKGLKRIERLVKLEESLGFRSSINLVPEQEYRVSDQLLRMLDQSGFEVGVHGLEHDGKLYDSKDGFEVKAHKINSYIKRWGASGFRSPLMQHRLGWLHRLNLEYDSSTFDTDPFEPEPDGVRTIFPFWVSGPDGRGFVELPYTLPQDFCLFMVLREPGINIWKQKLDWIAQRGGMAMLNTHPDYMCFDGLNRERDEFSVALYEEFLVYVREKYRDRFWAALPRDVNKFYRASVPAETRNTRLRVCMIAHSQYETDNRVRRFAESLAGRGDMVDVIALRSPGRGFTHELKGVNVYGIQHGANGRGGKWSDAWRLLRFLGNSFLVVTRRHYSINYDLIHVQSVRDFLVFAALYPKWTGAKVLLDIHALVTELPEGSLKSQRDGIRGTIPKIDERLSALLSDHVIVSDHSWQKRLIAHAVPEKKCTVFVNNIDPAICYRRARTRDDGKVIVLFPCTFSVDQGLDVAIKALGRLKDRLPNCELHFYGCGDRHSQAGLARLAAEAGLDGRVRFCGSVSADQIPEVMANADVGVVPKRADTFGSEAYSTRIMEFMSQGVPVAASRTADDSCCFTDQTVCFFPSGDDQAMAEVLLKLIEDRDLRDSMSRNGIEYAAANGWSSKKYEYLSLVDSLCTEAFQGAGANE